MLEHARRRGKRAGSPRNSSANRSARSSCSAARAYPYYFRVFETADDHFDYYRDYHAFWQLYGIELPDEVLRKVYYRNALRIAPRLPQDGWPE